MKNALSEIFSGAKSLFVGMRITLGQFFRPAVTVHYPHETLKIPPRFRGHIELVLDPQTGMGKCFVCKLCEKACPSDCITVEGIKPEGAKRKTVTHYRLDFTKCSLCGSCVEACRDGAIRFSRDYNLAGLNKDDFIMDLFKRLQDEAAQRKPAEPVTKPASLDRSPAVNSEVRPVVAPLAGNATPEPAAAMAKPQPTPTERASMEVK